MSFPLWETGPNRVTNPPPDRFNGFRRLSNAIRTERAATYAQMMSFEDSTIRIMGTLFRQVVDLGNGQYEEFICA